MRNLVIHAGFVLGLSISWLSYIDLKRSLHVRYDSLIKKNPFKPHDQQAWLKRVIRIRAQMLVTGILLTASQIWNQIFAHYHPLLR